MFLILNEEGRILSVNRFGVEQLGSDREAIEGHLVEEIINEDDMASVSDFIKAEDDKESEHVIARPKLVPPDKSEVWYKFSKRLLAHEGHERVILLVGHDYTETYQFSEKLSYEATHDALTGLINVRMFRQRLERILQRVKVDNSEHALCYMDLDRFKDINDRFGHRVGDRLLTELAALLMENVRKRDILARLGGDEFGLLMEHCNIQQVERVTNTLLDTVRNYRLNLPQGQQQVGVSIGVVAINSESGDYESVLHAADDACYQAKRMGRNRIFFADS